MCLGRTVGLLNRPWRWEIVCPQFVLGRACTEQVLLPSSPDLLALCNPSLCLWAGPQLKRSSRPFSSEDEDRRARRCSGRFGKPTRLGGLWRPKDRRNPEGLRHCLSSIRPPQMYAKECSRCKGLTGCASPDREAPNCKCRVACPKWRLARRRRPAETKDALESAAFIAPR